MNPQVTDELISAYFDGEVSPEERAAVERLLASSEDAQRELNETARLSALLHSFPREVAPVELASNVLRQTNQMPMPAQSAPNRTAAPVRSVRRDWLAGLIGAMATVAAALLVMAFYPDQPKHGADATMAMNHAESMKMESAPEAPAPMAAKSAEPIVAMDDRAEPRNEFDAKRASGPVAAEGDGVERAYEPASQAPAPAPGPPSNLAARTRTMMSRKAGEPAPEVAADAAAGTAVAAKPQVAQSMDVQQNDTSDLIRQKFVEGLRENNLITMSDPDNNVGVLMVEVEDIEKGGKLVQGLLKKNSIEQRISNEDGTATSNDVFIFYIVAPGDKLAKIMDDVQLHRDLLRKVVVEPPLQLALADEAKQQIEKKDADAQAKSVNKKQQADKPAAADEEVAEFQEVLGALSARNGMANPAYGNSITNSNIQFGVNRDGSEVLNRQLPADSIREKSKAEQTVRGGNPGANQAQAGANSRAGAGYDYARFNNSIVTNNTANGIANNSVTPLNQTNPAQNPFRLDQNNARRQVAYSNQDRALNNDSSRALRMLFVLHPQAEGSQAPPAAAVPSKQ